MTEAQRHELAVLEMPQGPYEDQGLYGVRDLLEARGLLKARRQAVRDEAGDLIRWRVMWEHTRAGVRRLTTLTTMRQQEGL